MMIAVIIQQRRLTKLTNQGKTINFPGLSVKLPCSAALNELLLVGGGRSPATDWLRAVAPERQIYAIDHGLDACFRAGLIPDFLLGDGDSASKENWQKAKQLAVPMEQHPVAKDLTDTQLELQKIKAGEPNSFILLTGCFGGRFDHLFSTAYSFLHSGLSGCLADDKEILFFLRDKQSMTVSFDCQPKALSLLPLSPVCDGVTSQGVLWPLEKASLSQQMPSAISNKLAKESQTWEIALHKGILGVYICLTEDNK